MGLFGKIAKGIGGAAKNLTTIPSQVGGAVAGAAGGGLLAGMRGKNVFSGAKSGAQTGRQIGKIHGGFANIAGINVNNPFTQTGPLALSPVQKILGGTQVVGGVSGAMRKAGFSPTITPPPTNIGGASGESTAPMGVDPSVTQVDLGSERAATDAALARYDANLARREALEMETRQAQTGLLRDLEAQRRGEGPSVAREEFGGALDRIIAANASLAASGRGMDSALRYRTAALNTADQTQEAAGTLAKMRADEIQTATNNQMSLLNQMRGQDLEGRGQTRGDAQVLEGVRQTSPELALKLEDLRSRMDLGRRGLINEQQQIGLSADIARAKLEFDKWAMEQNLSRQDREFKWSIVTKFLGMGEGLAGLAV